MNWEKIKRVKYGKRKVHLFENESGDVTLIRIFLPRYFNGRYTWEFNNPNQVIANLSFETKDGSVAKIHMLEVRNDYRKRGLVGELLVYLTNYLKEKKITNVIAHVKKDNISLFKKRYGFKIKENEKYNTNVLLTID